MSDEKKLKALRRFHRKNQRGEVVDIVDDEICSALMEENHFFYMNSRFWIYENGRYVQDKDGLKIRNLAADHMYKNFRRADRLNRVYALLMTKQEIQLDLRDINAYPPYWINFQNGMLDPATLELHPHDPKYCSINQLPHRWDPDHDLSDSIVRKYLTEWIPDVDDRRMVLEYSGYSLTTATNLQCLLFVTGAGALGKSVFTRLLQRALGPDNYSSLTLHRLSGNQSRFQTNFLFGKLANICADVSSEELEDVSLVKMLSGEDDVTGEIKGGTVYSFAPYAKFLFTCNRLPATREDRTNGWYRRLLILRITKRAEEIPDLELRLQDDVDSFIYMSVMALHNILVDADGHPIANPKISRSANSEREVEEFYCYSDSVRAFLRDKATRCPGAKCDRNVLLSAYRDWCTDEERQPLGKNRFFADLREKGFGETRDSNGRRYFLDLDVSPWSR